MTYEEAIKRIKNRICCEKPTAHFCTDNCMHGRKECEIAMAIDALEKQIPKKITEIHCDEYYCPACGAENNCDEYVVNDQYCPVCGHALECGD